MLSKNQMVAIRKAKEHLYTGSCTIVEYKKSKNKHKITEFTEEVVSRNIPCRLSFSSINNSDETSTYNKLTQLIKLILPPEVEIKAGSKIIVFQCGVTRAYKNSGVPAVYGTHQEVILELFKGWG